MITRIHESRTQYVTVQSKTLATQTQSYDKTTTSTSTKSVPAKSASAIFYILLTFLLNTIKSITLLVAVSIYYYLINYQAKVK